VYLSLDTKSVYILIFLACNLLETSPLNNHLLIGRQVYFLACDSFIIMRNSPSRHIIVLISAIPEFYRIWSPFLLDGEFKFYMVVGIQEAGGLNYWVGGGTEISDANTRPVYSVPACHWPPGCSTVVVKLSVESFRVKSRLHVSDYSGWPPTGNEQMTDSALLKTLFLL
jgi:hypothetical protein